MFNKEWSLTFSKMDHVIKTYFELVSEGLQTSIAALDIPKVIVKEDSAF